MKLARKLLNLLTTRFRRVRKSEGGSMSVSTRLIFFLTVAVGIVMVVSGYFILRQREAILARALRNELNAHTVTLQIALEDSFGAGRVDDAQGLIDRLSENPRISRIVLISEEGRVAISSSPLGAGAFTSAREIGRVLESGETISLFHHEAGQEVFSIIAPVRLNSTRRGAIEVSQPAELFQADAARARRDITVITLLLFATIILVVQLVMRLSLMRPIKELLTGARLIGEGNLTYRVTVPNGGSEITALAEEFNRMASGLNEQRLAIGHEAEERLRLERELRDSERLALVGRLASGVAHEMGTPLNVIKGRVEILRGQSDIPREKRLRHLNIIEAQADAIAVTVRQLLALARPLHLHCEPVAMADLIAGAVELIEAEAGQRRVTVEVGRVDHLHVIGDRMLLHQVMMNICVNGLHSMPEGGRLRIECLPATLSQSGRPCIGLRVIDTGYGIAPEHLEQIFDPFFTTKEIGEGTGLGLSVSRRIVEEHGGWIEAANGDDGGAAFSFWLPKAETTLEQGETE